MKALFVSSEIFPFAKSGGLGDVASSLPKALNSYIDTTSIMPLYSLIDIKKHDIKSTNFKYSFTLNNISYEFEVYKKEKVLFLKDFNHLFDRDQMYGGYEDNDIRFGIFCYAVVEYIKAKDEFFDILHINDWQSALIALLSKEVYKLNSKIVFTIHNLAYQGIFPKDAIDRLNLSWDVFKPSKLEYHDQINLLKSAINYSDVVSTVSPTYAKEIQTKQFGCNLENLIKYNEYKLRGILNGIDYDEFNPSSDSNLSKHFSLHDMSNKILIKKDILKELNLKDIQKPLFIFIGRFTAQKGIDILLKSIHNLSKLPINVAILGSGEDHYNDYFGSLFARYENISITIGYNEALARRLYAGADFLYMPSIYEPCGLNQMIAMKYGALPIVSEVGGLKDSVVDFESVCEFPKDKGLGISFKTHDVKTFLDMTKRALFLYHDQDRFQEIVKFNMGVDFSWHTKSKEYFELYNSLIGGWLPERKIKEFEIPTHYDKDTLKTIAVDPNTIFTYWEVTKELLDRYNITFDKLKLQALVDNQVVDEVTLHDMIGNYYFYKEIDFLPVMSKIGYEKDGNFVAILSSNIFIAPNSKMIYDKECFIQIEYKIDQRFNSQTHLQRVTR